MKRENNDMIMTDLLVRPIIHNKQGMHGLKSLEPAFPNYSNIPTFPGPYHIPSLPLQFHMRYHAVFLLTQFMNLVGLKLFINGFVSARSSHQIFQCDLAILITICCSGLAVFWNVQIEWLRTGSSTHRQMRMGLPMFIERHQKCMTSLKRES